MSAVPAPIVRLLAIYDLVSDDDTRLDRDEDHVNALAADFRARLKDKPDEHPVQTPLRVVPRGGKHSIVAGNNRYLAALRCGLRDLPCIVLSGDLDAADLLIERILDNRLHRPYTPLEDARNILRVKEFRGCSQAEAGRLVGVRNPSDVAKLLGVLKNFPPDLHDAIGEGEGKVPFTTAYALSRLPDPARVRELAGRVVQGLLTRDAAEDQVAADLRGKPAKPRKPITARSPKGLVVLIPPLDPDGVVAELTAVIEAVRRCVKSNLPLSCMPQLLKGA